MLRQLFIRFMAETNKAWSSVNNPIQTNKELNNVKKHNHVYNILKDLLGWFLHQFKRKTMQPQEPEAM